jgi:PAS domain S-box-containing protein
MRKTELQTWQLLAGDEQVRRLREMFVRSPSFSALLQGPEHRFVLTNPAYQQLIGHRNVIGLTVREAVPEAERQGFINLLDNVFATAEAFVGKDVKIVLQRSTEGPAETRYLDFVYQPIKDAGGNVTSIFVEGADITERHNSEEALRASEARLRQLNADLELQVIQRAQARGLTWKLSPDLLGALNSKGYFETANPAWESVLGWTEAEVLSMSIFDLLHPDDLEHTRAGFELTQVGQPALRFVNRYRRKDGSYRWISWIGIPEEGYVYCTGRDVTAEREAEIELAAAQEALRHSQKMEAIGELTGGVAHDFNNLLTVIMGYSQILTDGLPGASRLKDATTQIRSAADRVAGITRQLLAFSRKQVLSPRVIDLNDVMLNLDTMLRRLIGEDVEVLTVPGRDLGAVRADPGQIEQVIMNLALNARDAMPNGGKLTFETENMELDASYASEHEPLQPGRYVMLAVSDTGTGMSPDTQAHIFEPFFTTKEVGKGTGLGLSMVYGIVKQSGGYIWVYSEPGRGTSFKIYLPRVDQLAEAIALEKRPASVRRGTETILLVEDDAQLRALTSSVLIHCGYKVLSAAGTEEGLALCRENHRDIHLLVTDVIMPGMNGRQLAEQVKQISPSTKILYVSGYTSNAIVHYGVLDPGLRFLPKPFSLAALVAKVREVLDGSDAPDRERPRIAYRSAATQYLVLASTVLSPGSRNRT